MGELRGVEQRRLAHGLSISITGSSINYVSTVHFVATNNSAADSTFKNISSFTIRYARLSMVMHNPPAHKVAHFFRSKLTWEAKKDRILQSCMSKKWVKLRQDLAHDKSVESGKERLREKTQRLLQVEKHLDDDTRQSSRDLLASVAKKTTPANKIRGLADRMGGVPSNNRRDMFKRNKMNIHNFSSKGGFK